MLSPKLIKHRILKVQKDLKRLRIAHDLGYSEADWKDMQRHMLDYKDFVVEKFAEAEMEDPQAAIFLEKKFNLERWIPESWGTGDVSMGSRKVGRFVDLKYGKGVPVKAEANPQLMIYALGFYEKFYHIYGFRQIELTIYQPRLDDISTYTISVKDLLSWAKNVLRPAAKLAYEGEGEYSPSEKACKFCRGKARCEALANYNLELAKHEFAIENYLDDAGVIDALERGPLIVDWYNAVKEHALNAALDGKKWPGYKLVHGRAVRKYADEAEVADALLGEGYEKTEIYNRKLKGILEMESLLGKNGFKQILGDLIIKPDGAPTLVDEATERYEYRSAAHEFDDDFDDF